ncbi:hypothetical protein [Bradyrhizobium sp. USDA 10063]
MPIDLNGADTQREMGVIDDGTIAVVQMNVRPGHAGEGGWLKRSQSGECEMLDCEFTVVQGPFAKRKFWNSFVLVGVSEGHQKAAEISMSRLRAIRESAFGIRPDDMSDEAQAVRRFDNWGAFDGIRFIAKIGIEKAQPGSGYKDKNVLDAAITPDRAAWTKVEQTLKTATAVATVGSTLGGAQAAPTQSTMQKPKWASG